MYNIYSFGTNNWIFYLISECHWWTHISHSNFIVTVINSFQQVENANIHAHFLKKMEKMLIHDSFTYLFKNGWFWQLSERVADYDFSIFLRKGAWKTNPWTRKPIPLAIQRCHCFEPTANRNEVLKKNVEFTSVILRWGKIFTNWSVTVIYVSISDRGRNEEHIYKPVKLWIVKWNIKIHWSKGRTE